MRGRALLTQDSHLDRPNKMPNDKNAANVPPRKPLTPNVSSAFRPGRTPVAPKLAGSFQPIPFVSPRDGNRTGQKTSPAVHTPTAPTSSHLDSNVTPSSGTRNTKFDSSPVVVANAHADIAPRSRPASVVGSQNSGYGTTKSSIGRGLGISNPNNMTTTPVRPLSMIVGDSTSPSARRPSITRDAELPMSASRFFHADDAQSSVSVQSADERPHLQTKAATFFYADEASERPRSIHSTPNLLPRKEGSKQGKREPMGIAQPRSVPTPPTVRGATRRSPSPRIGAPGRQQKVPNRPVSPLKALSLENMPSRIETPKIRKDEFSAPPRQVHESTSTSSASQLRRPSTGSFSSNLERSGHRKTPSIGTPPSPRQYRKSSLSINSSPQAIQAGVSGPQPGYVSSPEASPHSTSLGSSNGVHSLVSESFRSPEIAPLSPTKPAQQQQQSQIQKMNDLAANARRERKVLDLEISNSSLLAINRTLEKELRKQAGELRRFRRLSRAGRLSAMASSVRSLSGQSALALTDDLDDRKSEASHLSEIDEPEDDEDVESSSDDGDGASIESRETREARHRARDERRLLLDLSKHHQMLVDSQKVSLSIRRCVTWTEELIAEGQKALAYNVRVSDVEIGGRVLTHEDDNDLSSGRGLLSPAAQVEEINPWEATKTLESTESIPDLMQDLDGLTPG